MSKGKFLSMLVFVVLVSAMPGIGLAQDRLEAGASPEGWWGSANAYTIAFTHYDPWYMPHYGAWFGASYCYNQHYHGQGGDAQTSPYDGGISNWNWWGTYRNVLLLPKEWLLFGTPAAHVWNANNYSATCYYN
jgi:hypothetical protein